VALLPHYLIQSFILPSLKKKTLIQLNFEIASKIEILVDDQKKIAMCLWSTKQCVHRSDFQCDNFFYVFFGSKTGLCMWISAYPLEEKGFFHNVPHLQWIWDIVDTYLIHLWIGIQRGSFHINPKKWIFFASKLYYTPRAHAEKTFLSTLTVMFSQMVRNESLRFGVYVHI
jgi:hypothetical protein